MKLELTSYLQRIKEDLSLDPASETEVIRELEAHVEDSCREMQNDGLPEGEALDRCLKLLGPAKTVARQIYEAHNQGTWRQALLAALPHFFFAAMFALKWWMGVTWLPIMFAVILVIGLYGWSHGKPTWLFPWLSYSLFPVVAAGVSLLYLPTAWSWVTLAIYIPCVLWLLSFITIKFLRRDWLYSALMLLPASALVISGVIISLVIILASNALGLASFIGLVLLILSFLLVPAYVERKVKRVGQYNQTDKLSRI